MLEVKEVFTTDFALDIDQTKRVKGITSGVCILPGTKKKIKSDPDAIHCCSIARIGRRKLFSAQKN
jgi:hypothetical protein